MSVPTPRAHLDTEPLSNGILRARQEIDRMVTSVRTAVQIAEEAQRSSTTILDETLAASEELKIRVDRERGQIEEFRAERDGFATKLEVLEGWRHSIEDQLRTKTAEAKELEDKLKFAESETQTSRRQAAAVDDMWQASIAKLKASEEARAELQSEMDAQRQTARVVEKRANELQSRNARLEAALLEASAENSLLEARLSSFERYIRENDAHGSQHSSPEERSGEDQARQHPKEGEASDLPDLHTIEEKQSAQDESRHDDGNGPRALPADSNLAGKEQEGQGKSNHAPSRSSC